VLVQGLRAGELGGAWLNFARCGWFGQGRCWLRWDSERRLTRRARMFLKSTFAQSIIVN
jgi:hypothetical protein